MKLSVTHQKRLFCRRPSSVILTRVSLTFAVPAGARRWTCADVRILELVTRPAKKARIVHRARGTQRRQRDCIHIPCGKEVDTDRSEWYDRVFNSKALAKRYSQLKPIRAKFTTSMELGIVCYPLGLSWIGLAWSPGQTVLPTRAKFTTSIGLGIVWLPTWLELDRVGLKPWPNGPPNSSQLEPSSQLR